MKSLLLLLLSFNIVGLNAMEQKVISITEAKQFPGCSKFVMYIKGTKAVSIEVLTQKMNLVGKYHESIWKEYADHLDEAALMYHVAREPGYKNSGCEQELIGHVLQILFSRKIKFIAAQAKVRDNDALEIMKKTSIEDWEAMQAQENEKFKKILSECGFKFITELRGRGTFMHKICQNKSES
jgi:hypothetical protein